MSLDPLILAMKPHYSEEDVDRFTIAIEFATEAHAGQVRKSGTPYIDHPRAVAEKLLQLRMDADTVIAGILHDVPEDTTRTLEDIEGLFGADVAFLVSGVTKVGKLKYRGLERYIENLQKMFVAMAEDVRVIIIKFCDRLHNLETLGALPREKQLRIARESIEVYAPLADRLGIGEIKGQLEDLAFPFLEPKGYAWILQTVGPEYHNLEEHMAEMVWKLRERLAQEDMPPLDLHGRRKHLYSLYKKVLRPEYQKDLRRVTDIVAVRVIMPNISGCYAALGIVHQLWKPMPGRFKDYIAQPKPNGYQSLHTTVFGPGGSLVEVQVRDQEMHDLAERGIAAHWFYNEQGKQKHTQNVSQKLSWVQELSEWKKHFDSPEQYLEDIKIDALQQHIFCFTPNGDVIDLPEGATVIDFAYHVHSDLGNGCVGGKINGNMSALDSILRSGDVVEILTDKRRKLPNRDWLQMAKTHAARSHIRRALRDEVSKL